VPEPPAKTMPFISFKFGKFCILKDWCLKR